MNAWQKYTARLMDATAALIASFEDYEPAPPQLEGISIREIEYGPYDGMYEIIGLCRTCNQCVSHMIHPDATGDELHRAFHCECRKNSAGGYRLPHVVGGDGLFAHSPMFAADLRHGQGFGFDPFPAGRELR